MQIQLTRDALLDILEYLHVEVNGETSQDLIAYCPFHINKGSPALNIGKEPPYPWRCWNSSCAVSGTLLKLVEVVGEMTPMQALRFLYKYQTDASSLKDLLTRPAEEEPYEPWPEERLDGVRVDYDDQTNPAIAYMLSRGFTKETLKHFEIGYSKLKHRVVIPVRDETNALVGFSGRAIEPDQEPRYWDKGLPKKYVLFHNHIAQGYREVIVTEGPLDAMKVWQAGFPNVVAIFGGGFANPQREKLTRGYQSCIIFTDNPEIDEAGRALAEKVSTVMRKAGKEVFVARYPEEIKDPGEMSEQQIIQAIEQKESILRLRLRLGGIKQ
jgi:5S rRNA maturation endonuclease (ribonuclease M5)